MIVLAQILTLRPIAIFIAAVNAGILAFNFLFKILF